MSTSVKAPASARGDDLVAYPAKMRLSLAVVLLLVVGTLVFIGDFGFPPTWHLSPGRVVTLFVLLILGALVVPCLLGLFSPLPLFSIGHEGIRTFSLFGLFGTELIGWSHVRTIITYQAGGQRYLKIYSDNQSPIGRWSLVRYLLRRESEVMRVFTSSGIMSGSMDVLLKQMERRYGREIAENGVVLIDQGEK